MRINFLLLGMGGCFWAFLNVEGGGGSANFIFGGAGLFLTDSNSVLGKNFSARDGRHPLDLSCSMLHPIRGSGNLGHASRMPMTHHDTWGRKLGPEALPQWQVG